MSPEVLTQALAGKEFYHLMLISCCALPLYKVTIKSCKLHTLYLQSCFASFV